MRAPVGVPTFRSEENCQQSCEVDALIERMPRPEPPGAPLGEPVAPESLTL
jgi:hypothetical protein